jgi:hypothetical protein
MASISPILQIELMFSKLTAPNIFPSAGTLSHALNNLVDETSGATCHVDGKIVSYFASAGVEMWHRAIHSFLVSASIMNTSPLWSSVAGYYSSHYSMRAFAHTLGFFHLFGKGKSIELDLSGKYVCHISNKLARDGEHKFYWKVLKKHPFFLNDPFFTINDFNLDESDSGHRNKANYFDHLNNFPHFQVLDEEFLKQRLVAMSRTVVNDAPLPNKTNYPDIDNVQLIAYHRLVKYKMFLDEILGANSNRFWAHHRRPTWCPQFVNFQIANPEHIVAYRDFTI